MRSAYPVLFTKADSDILVEVPDLEILTEAKDLSDAIAMARDAIYRRRVDMKTVRKNVAIPSWMNYEAEKAGLNVSRVLQDALANILGTPRRI